MLNQFALAEGSAVRLSVDTGHASVGFLVDVDHVRESDGMTFWLVDFDGWRTPPTVHAESTLVPVCEHSETFRDEWGAACSEDNVPLWFDVPCRFDATHTISFVDPAAPGPFHMNLCDEHTTLYVHDPDLSIVADRPLEVAS